MVVDLGELARGLGVLADLDLTVDAKIAAARAVGAARGLLAVDAAGLMVVHADGHLRWVTVSNGPEPTGAAWRKPLTVGPAVVALEELRPVVVEDVAADPGWQPVSGASGTGAALSVTVLVDGAPVDVLELYRAVPGTGMPAGSRPRGPLRRAAEHGADGHRGRDGRR